MEKTSEEMTEDLVNAKVLEIAGRVKQQGYKVNVQEYMEKQKGRSSGPPPTNGAIPDCPNSGDYGQGGWNLTSQNHLHLHH